MVLVQPFTSQSRERRFPSLVPCALNPFPGAGVMEADDRKVTTVFTVQPSFHRRYSTNRVS